jgi:hypothetical protein
MKIIIGYIPAYILLANLSRKRTVSIRSLFRVKANICVQT